MLSFAAAFPPASTHTERKKDHHPALPVTDQSNNVPENSQKNPEDFTFLSWEELEELDEALNSATTIKEFLETKKNFVLKSYLMVSFLKQVNFWEASDIVAWLNILLTERKQLKDLVMITARLKCSNILKAITNMPSISPLLEEELARPQEGIDTDECVTQKPPESTSQSLSAVTHKMDTILDKMDEIDLNDSPPSVQTKLSFDNKCNEVELTIADRKSSPNTIEASPNEPSSYEEAIQALTYEVKGDKAAIKNIILSKFNIIAAPLTSNCSSQANERAAAIAFLQDAFPIPGWQCEMLELAIENQKISLLDIIFVGSKLKQTFMQQLPLFCSEQIIFSEIWNTSAIKQVLSDEQYASFLKEGIIENPALLKVPTIQDIVTQNFLFFGTKFFFAKALQLVNQLQDTSKTAPAANANQNSHLAQAELRKISDFSPNCNIQALILNKFLSFVGNFEPEQQEVFLTCVFREGEMKLIFMKQLPLLQDVLKKKPSLLKIGILEKVISEDPCLLNLALAENSALLLVPGIQDLIITGSLLLSLAAFKSACEQQPVAVKEISAKILAYAKENAGANEPQSAYTKISSLYYGNFVFIVNELRKYLLSKETVATALPEVESILPPITSSYSSIPITQSASAFANSTSNISLFPEPKLPFRRRSY